MTFVSLVAIPSVLLEAPMHYLKEAEEAAKVVERDHNCNNKWSADVDAAIVTMGHTNLWFSSIYPWGESRQYPRL